MYRFLGIGLLAITLAACQPATTSPTKTVNAPVSSAADTASTNDVIWQGGTITPFKMAMMRQWFCRPCKLTNLRW